MPPLAPVRLGVVLTQRSEISKHSQHTGSTGWNAPRDLRRQPWNRHSPLPSSGWSSAWCRVGGDSVPTVFQQPNVPQAIRALSTLASPDYVGLFTIATDGAAGRSPERWARAGVEDAAGLAGQFVWRVLCGLRLERRPSPDYVGGWKIADRGDNWIRLEAASWFMTAHLVVEVDG